MAASANCKTVVIGLDVGDGRLIHDWAAAGHLPTFRSLIDGGAWGWLDTPAQHLHVSAWPSLYTGTSPGEHGVYFTFQPAPGQQGYRKFTTDQYGRPTFWRMLSDAGVRCTVFDAPYTHPEQGFNGVQIFEWGTWAHYTKPTATPPEMWKRLRSQCGNYPLGMEANDIGLARLDPADMQRRLIDSTAAKTKASAWLLRETSWDLFFTVFSETHPAAHYCWSPATSGHGSTDLLLPIYQAIDRGIADIIASAGEGVRVFVVSGDGVGPNHAGWHLLPEVLRRLGYLAIPEPKGNAPKPASGADVSAQSKGDAVAAIRNLIPKDLRRQIARRLPAGIREALARRVDLGSIDWSRTRAYTLPTDLEGCIRINLQGREPAGIVRPEEYRAVCDELAAALAELVEPGTGRRVVRGVIRTDDVFSGSRRGYLPDLIVLWNDEREVVELSSPRIGVVAGSSPDGRPGTHAPTGFVLAHGPSIAAGTTIDGGHVFDLAPTLLTQFGARIPNHVDGRPWASVAPH